MNENKPLVSLVVPTKNRYPYLIKLIELLLSFNLDKRFELIIQDNNEDNSSFLKFLEGKHIPYLKYYYDPTPMPIGANCDKAILHSTGEFVSFIGDDDFVTRNFMPCVEWMKTNNVDCVFPRRIMYYWPDYCEKEDEKAAVHFESFSNQIVYFDTTKVLSDLFESGCLGIGDIPMIYHGIVKRSVLEKIWDNCGTLFPGASPDISSGICLCMVLDNYASFKFPIIIAGNSRTGGGGQRVIKHHAVTDFSKLTFLPKDTEKKWCKRIPKIWSNVTIWCESVVETLNVWNRQDLVEKIDFEKFYTYFMVNHSYYWAMAYKLSNDKPMLILNSLKGAVVLQIKNFVKAILNLMHINTVKSRTKVHGISSSSELISYFEEKGYFFDNYFK